MLPHTPSASGWPPGTLLDRLSAAAVCDLLSLAAPRLYPAGAVLLNQGDPSTHVLVIGAARTGIGACVKVAAATENGAESLLGIRLSGDVVGELAGLRRGARTATVVTCTPVTILPVPQAAFQAWLDRTDGAWAALCCMIADRLDWANRRRMEYAAYDVPVRLARLIVDLAERHGVRTAGGHELGVLLTQGELGKLIGAGEDAVGQAMRQLRDADLVTPHYRGVTVRSLDAVRHFAGIIDPL